VAAITDSPEDRVYTEKDWNETSSLTRNPYYYSKTLAEKVGWEFAKKNKIDLVVINPFMVIGPSLTESNTPSNSTLLHLIDKSTPALVDLCWCFVDVRDVATAHIRAIQEEKASGRYICANQTYKMTDFAQYIRTKFPNYASNLPSLDLTSKFGVGLTKFVSYFQSGQVGDYLRTNLGRTPQVDNNKVKSDLKMTFIPLEQSFEDLINDFIKWGHLPELRPCTLSAGELGGVLEKLKNSGIEIKEQCIHFKSHPNCFNGKAAIDHLVKILNVNHRSKACRVADALVAQGSISCLNTKEFADNDSSFFVFVNK